MKKYKYVLSVSMLGLCSQLSATTDALEAPASGANTSSASGANTSSASGKNASSSSGANLSLAIVQPSALEFLIPGDNGTYTTKGMLAFSSRETVADLKAKIIEAYRLSGSFRFMVDVEEVMTKMTRFDGTLVTLSEAFKGRSGIVQIKVEKN